VPEPIFSCYVRMLGRIQAEEALAGRATIAAGSGAMEKDDQKTWLREQRAKTGRRRQTRKVGSVSEIAAIGIKVKKGGES
jgi:hypothetical protein